MPAPVILVATPGAPNANSYATLAEADAYNAGVVGGEAWSDEAVTRDQRLRALVHATRVLDAHVDWIGERATESQALEWPRAWAPNRSGSFYSDAEVPRQVVYAVSELARRLVTGATSLTGGSTGTENLKRLKAGPVELEFKQDAVVAAAVVPDDVLQMVRFLTLSAAGAQIRSVPVRRV